MYTMPLFTMLLVYDIHRQHLSILTNMLSTFDCTDLLQQKKKQKLEQNESELC